MTRRQFGAVLMAGSSAMQIRDAAARRVQPFPMKQVRLLDGICFYFMERDRGYLHSLEADRLLHNFRVNARLASSAEPLAGWERPDIELRGHFTGHYLSACALMYSCSGDEMIRTKANAMVSELGRCQKALGDGYLSAFPKEFFTRLRERLPVWAPWYTVHKIMAGLLDMHLHCENAEALSILEGMARWTQRWADPINDTQLAKILEVEYGGMNDLLYNLYAVTGRREYMTLGQRFDHARLFGPLAEGRDELRGQHVNTTIPKIIGAARRYELTGEERYRRIAEFFWKQVVEHRSYVTGGVSNHERWLTEPDKLASELSAVTQECCCTYNMLKLTRHIFAWNGESRAADYYERALLNGILGTMNPKDAMLMYYVPLEPGYWKVFSLPRASFWCCTGTGIESFAKLNDSIFFRDESGVFVNLFIPARVEWPEKGLILRQETRFPDEDSSAFEVAVKAPVELALRVRSPHWLAQPMTVKVNGREEKFVMERGYASIQRTWQNGDRVEVRLPMKVRVETMPDDSTIQSFVYGPLVLAAKLGRQGLTREMEYGDAVNARGGKFLRGDPLPPPPLRSGGSDVGEWIRPVAGQPATFETTGQKQNLRLIPLNRLFEERFAVYFKVQTAI